MSRALTLTKLLRRSLGDVAAADAEAFWETVRATLRAGRLRLVFIADQLARTQSVVSQVCG